MRDAEMAVACPHNCGSEISVSWDWDADGVSGVEWKQNCKCELDKDEVREAVTTAYNKIALGRARRGIY